MATLACTAHWPASILCYHIFLVRLTVCDYITLSSEETWTKLVEPSTEIVSVEAFFNKLDLIKELVSKMLTLLTLMAVIEVRDTRCKVCLPPLVRH